MKRRPLLTTFTALAVSLGFFAPPIADAQNPSTTLTAPVTSAYGFAARLAKDTESFSASYRLHELWLSLANSKWANTLIGIPELKEIPEVQRVITQWNSPDGQQARTLAAEILGQEIIIAAPAGFSDKFKPLFEAYSTFGNLYFQKAFMAGFSGRPVSPSDIQDALKEAAPTLIPQLAQAEVPPLLIISKAAKAKPFLDGVFAQVTGAIGKDLPPAFEAGSFKVDKYDFQSISVVAEKLVPPPQQEQVRQQLGQILGDPAKGKELFDKLKVKRAEIAWGWVDDYFVLSIGPDHSHVKFAATPADSILAVPEVAVRAAALAPKNPLGLSYVGKSLFDKFAAKIEFADAFGRIVEDLKGILKPEAITGMKADVAKLEKQVQTLFTPAYDSQIDIGWWEGGLRGETYGGARNEFIDSSKPLVFASLLSPTTFALFDTRSSEKGKLTVDFLEEAAATLWNWYDKYGRSMVPETEREQAEMIAATAVPLVKQTWVSLRKLGKALGTESALIVDLNGNVPRLPDIPAPLVEGKIPRIAWVAELTDRAAVSESWKGISSVIKQVTAMIGGNNPVPDPQTNKEGDLEIHFIPLPIETGDLLPHIAISKDRWIMSTSPSFSKELAAKPLGGALSLGGQYQVSFTALWDFGNQWLAVLDKNAEKLFSEGEARDYRQARPLISVGMRLASSLQSIDLKLFKDGGLNRASVFIKIEDLK